MLSVIVITRNEERHIDSCLRSCEFADERIVVDSGSTDDTVARAKAAGARVVVRSDWAGFGIQKNRALDEAQGSWVLSIDADERISDALRAEILDAIRRDDMDGYLLRTETDFYGRSVRFSEFYANTSSVRLFRRGLGRFTDAIVHENVILSTPRIDRLRNPLKHLSYVDPDAYLRKLQLYSALQAKILHSRGRRAHYATALGRAAAAFLKSYVVRLGILDGVAGLMVAVFAAEMTYHKYFRLMLLCNPPRQGLESPDRI